MSPLTETSQRSVSGHGSLRTCRTCWQRRRIDVPARVSGRIPIFLTCFKERWSGPRDAEEAGLWLSVEERGWEHGDWLTFAVTDVSQDKAVGHVGLWNRDGGQVGSGERVRSATGRRLDSRGRGIAPAGVRAVTGWAFDDFTGSGPLPRIMLVHDLGNPASVPGSGEEWLSVSAP